MQLLNVDNRNRLSYIWAIGGEPPMVLWTVLYRGNEKNTTIKKFMGIIIELGLSPIK